MAYPEPLGERLYTETKIFLENHVRHLHKVTHAVTGVDSTAYPVFNFVEGFCVVHMKLCWIFEVKLGMSVVWRISVEVRDLSVFVCFVYPLT